jgi:hypothetical protein
MQDVSPEQRKEAQDSVSKKQRRPEEKYGHEHPILSPKPSMLKIDY